MRIKNKAGAGKLLAILLSLCLVISVVGGAVTALGAIEKVSLTVNTPDSYTDDEDFTEANVVIDMYQLGGASKDDDQDTYNYTLMAPYDNLKLSEEMDDAAWEKLGYEAAAIAREEGNPIVTNRALGEKIDSSDDGTDLGIGLYLVIAHGADEEDFWDTAPVTLKDGTEIEGDVTTAEGSVYKYTFTPQIRLLPSKDDVSGDGSAMTSVEDGEWIADVEMTLKPDRAENYASLTIRKTVRNFEGTQATFVYRVVATNDKGEVVFEDIATIQMGQSGSETALVEKIPAGTDVTVTEEYSGARYEPVGGDTRTIEKISAADENVVDFENTRNDNDIQGYGIENHFTNADGWQWEKR